jgi:hypothetical protein
MVAIEFVDSKRPRRPLVNQWLNEPAPITNQQLLALNNAIEDLRQEVARQQHRIAKLERSESLNEQALTTHEDMLARYDDRLVACEQSLDLALTEPIAFGRGSGPGPDAAPLPSPVPTMADCAVDPRMVALDSAITHMITGALIAQRFGILGSALDDYVCAAIVAAEYRFAAEQAS